MATPSARVGITIFGSLNISYMSSPEKQSSWRVGGWVGACVRGDSRRATSYLLFSLSEVASFFFVRKQPVSL